MTYVGHIPHLTAKNTLICGTIPYPKIVWARLYVEPSLIPIVGAPTGAEGKREIIVAHSPPDASSHPIEFSAARPEAFRVVAIGASAGGLRALGIVLAALPADFAAPILVVQHLSPDFPSHLAHILSRDTALHVKEAEEGDRLECGWVYIAPPGRHLVANADGILSLTRTAKRHHCRPSVDVLLLSVAASFGARAVGVILTGGDGDGAAGIEAIRAAHGVTFAESPESSEHPSMPRSAIDTGTVDFVLTLERIAPALTALLQTEVPAPAT